MVTKSLASVLPLSVMEICEPMVAVSGAVTVGAAIAAAAAKRLSNETGSRYLARMATPLLF